MARRDSNADRWLRTTFIVGLLHGVFLAVVLARPGLPAVVLWYVAPVLLALAAAILLGIAFYRSWRRREVPGTAQLSGLAVLGIVVLSLALFRTYPAARARIDVEDVRLRERSGRRCQECRQEKGTETCPCVAHDDLRGVA